MAVKVRRLSEDEVGPWRDLRLRMLLDTPGAFGRTHAEEVAMPQEEWEARTRRLATSAERAMFVADDEGRLVGSAGVFLDPDDELRPHLIAMWVAPAARRRGVGRALVEAVLEWARGAGRASVRLLVVDHNQGAIRLYEEFGFRRTGTLIPLPRDPAVMEVEMRLDRVG